MAKTSSTPYCFVSGLTSKAMTPAAHKYVLSIRQQPQRAKICGQKERDRRPIDPPPIVQIKLSDPSSDRNKDFLQSPYLFMCCNVVEASAPMGDIVAPAHHALAGIVVSSLNRLKDVDNSDGGFFVFGDMSVRIEGTFCLRFTLFELIKGEVVHVMSTNSNPFTVHSAKTFPGMLESTFLSRSFSDQGVRIRLCKSHANMKPKRPSQASIETPESSIHSPPTMPSDVPYNDPMAVHKNSAKRSKPVTSIAPATKRIHLANDGHHRSSTSNSAYSNSPPLSPVGGQVGGQDVASAPSWQHPKEYYKSPLQSASYPGRPAAYSPYSRHRELSPAVDLHWRQSSPPRPYTQSSPRSQSRKEMDVHHQNHSAHHGSSRYHSRTPSDVEPSPPYSSRPFLPPLTASSSSGSPSILPPIRSLSIGSPTLSTLPGRRYMESMEPGHSRPIADHFRPTGYYVSP